MTRATIGRGVTRALSGEPVPPGYELVPARRLVEPAIDVWFPLRPGDRPRVASGDTVTPGSSVADRVRDPRLAEMPLRFGGRPGERWSREIADAGAGKRTTHQQGELLFQTGGRWRIAAGDDHDPLESPVTGVVRGVRPGISLSVRTAGSALRGVLALGDASRGRLEIATDADGEIRPRSLDVGSAGAILVVGARIDAEALTRARAMGIRGIVVATLPGKDLRDYLASEARQRAAHHRLQSFGVLVLHGSSRRPIGEAQMRLLQRLSGAEVAIMGTPPALLFDAPATMPEADPPGSVQVRTGPLAGRTARWAGLAGLRSFAGTHLEAAFVRFGDDAPVALPLADLERFR